MYKWTIAECVSKHNSQLLTKQNIQPRSISWISAKNTQKGGMSDPNKLRGIAPLDICSKLISSILANILETHFRTFVNEAEYGSL